MEPLAASLGISVGKAVFKAWFKDNEFASSISESTLDLLKGSIADRRAQSAAERHIGRISERAADALETFIEFEWSNLSQLEKSEAINVVQNCIDELNINSSLMAAIEFSAERLSALVVSKLQDGGLCPEAKELASILAHEAAQMIADLASSLPEFHRDSFAEVLKRESEIISKLDRVFEELESIRNTSNRDSSSAAYSLFEQTYRRSLARQLDQIELFGMDSGIRQSSRQHSLSTAYISLSVTGGADVNPDAEEIEGEIESDTLSEKKSVFSVRAEEAANLSQLVVIKGEAGSGKTTLLQSLAVRCAIASYDGEMESWNELVPFFIRLRALSGPDLPGPEDLPSLVTPMISGTMPSGWVHQQLGAGRGLILIDGLDEVSVERRDATRKWINHLIAEYPLSRIVVTSRPTAIPDGWLSQKGFKQLELLPMSPDDVAVFIDHWHEAVGNEEHDNERRLKVKNLVPSLKERIRTDRALKELAGTPLLCAMLCAMNRDRKQVLPKNRIALYDAAVQMILHGRDEERKIKVESLVPLDLETKQNIIQEIAFWMMQNGSSMADQWRIEDYVATLMPALTKLNPLTTSKDLVATLIQRSGVIRSPIDGKIDFVHNAFKEFLCAKAVTAGDRFGYLETMLNNEAWREVAVLAAAMTDERRRAEFIGNLLQAGDGGGSSAKATYHLLAVRCLETCTQLDPDLQSGIKERLSNLAAPNSVTEARSLSAAGELALPLLKRSHHFYARTAAACVRALRFIGTPESQKYIAEYAPDRRATVAKEVIAAWPFFDAIDYAKEVLSNSRGVYGNIRIDYPEYVSAIKYLAQISGLTVSLRKHEISDDVYRDISSLTHLSRLALHCRGRCDIANLVGLANLSWLSIVCDTFSSVNSIHNFSEIHRFTFSGASDEPMDLSTIPLSVGDITIIGRNFQFTGMPRVNNIVTDVSIVNDIPHLDLEYLKGFTRLTDLSVKRIHSDDQLSNIGICHSLTHLRMDGISGVKCIDAISDLENLTSLHIHNAEYLEDIEALYSLKKLRKLSIIGAANLIDVRVLSKLESINEVSLDINEAADVGFIKDIPSLKAFRLSRRHKMLDGTPVSGLHFSRMVRVTA